MAQKGKTVEENLAKLSKTPILMNFVKKHEGNWGHSDWNELLETLEKKGYDPICPDQVGLMLEEKKKKYLSSK